MSEIRHQAEEETTMNLHNYFANCQGTGIIATADAGGKVDAAVYARPHVMDDGTVAMIMRDRLTHKNLQENPYAVYLFIEHAPGYRGVRLFLKKVHEDQDAGLIAEMTRRSLTEAEDEAKGPKFLVYFEVEKTLKLIGGEELQFGG